MCCGHKMRELVPNTTDAAVEKHVPVIQVEGNHVTVTVSTAEHPMVEEHFIEWIALGPARATSQAPGPPGQKPQAGS